MLLASLGAYATGMFRVDPWKFDNDDDEPEPYEPPDQPNPPERPLEILRF